jgi:hypothetical protein
MKENENRSSSLRSVFKLTTASVFNGLQHSSRGKFEDRDSQVISIKYRFILDSFSVFTHFIRGGGGGILRVFGRFTPHTPLCLED